jgi:hypothetical protein
MVRFSWGNGKRLNENRVESVVIVFGMNSFMTDLGLSGRKTPGGWCIFEPLFTYRVAERVTFTLVGG